MLTNVTRELSIVLRPAFSSSVATHTYVQNGVTVLVPSLDPDENPTVVTEKFEGTVELRSWRFVAEGLARRWLVGGLWLHVGASAGFHQVSDWKETNRLLEPPNARLINPDPTRYTSPDNGRTLVLTDEDLPGVNHLSLAGIAGLAYALPLDNVTIMPELRLRYDVIEPGTTGAWHPLSIEAMISVEFGEIIMP